MIPVSAKFVKQITNKLKSGDPFGSIGPWLLSLFAAFYITAPLQQILPLTIKLMVAWLLVREILRIEKIPYRIGTLSLLAIALVASGSIWSNWLIGGKAWWGVYVVLTAFLLTPMDELITAFKETDGFWEAMKFFYRHAKEDIMDFIRLLALYYEPARKPAQ